MNLTFWGVRGSIPVPGAGTLRWGGNSSCVALTVPGAPPLLLDCGTGARALGQRLLAAGERDVHVLFTHLHIDHVFGLPFFGPLYVPGGRVELGVPAVSPVDAETRLGRFMNGIYHPVRLGEVPGRVAFTPIRPGPAFGMGPWELRSVGLNHPGGALGYRVTLGGRSVVYLTDTAPLARPGEGVVDGRLPPALEQKVLDLLAGADACIFDTMFTQAQYMVRQSWGHSYPEYAVALCRAAGVRRLFLYHHAPELDDDALDALDAHWMGVREGGLTVRLAREGESHDLT